MPATFTIPALTIPGDTASVVTIDHPAVPEDRTVTLTATYGGRMLSADFPVPKSTDLVTINEAEQTLKDAQLKVEATGTIALATLSLYDDATGGFIGSMQLKGLLNAGGKFQFQGNVASVRTLRLVSTFGGVTRFNVSQKSLESELHSVTAMQGGSHIGVTSRA